MDFYLSNTELDAQISEIRRQIRLSMNGIVSDQMKMNGIVYKHNYGVTIPRIKEIAKMYSPNHDLSQRLWMLKIRETMIMSTLLQPVEKFTCELALKRIDELDQIEIVEQICMNLLCKLRYANNLCVECVRSEKMWIQITGFILAARVYNQLNENETHIIIEKAFEGSTTTEFHLYKAIALCLSRFCRMNAQTAKLIEERLDMIFQKDSMAQQYIAGEVKQEILFLNSL